MWKLFFRRYPITEHIDDRWETIEENQSISRRFIILSA